MVKFIFQYFQWVQIRHCFVQGFLKFFTIDAFNKTAANIVQKSDLIVITLQLIQPKSRGFINLKKSCSKKCKIADIQPNILSDAQDRETNLRIIKQQINLMNSPAFKKLGATLIRYQIPECDEFEYLSDSYWICYMQYASSIGSHPHGTSKMGPSNDASAVVDSRCKVHKINRLRQADNGM